MNCPLHNTELVQEQILLYKTTNTNEDDLFAEAMICDCPDCEYFILL